MFKLTKQEQLIVAFLAGAILLGTAVRVWRVQHPKTGLPAEVKGKVP